MKLWAHQSRAISQLRSAINQGHRRIVVVGPTGSGKGTLATEILRLAVQQGNRGLLTVHRREIVLDIAERLRKVGVLVGVILPGVPPDPTAPIQVASVDTLKNRIELPPADILLVDECHHYASNKWSALVDRYPNAIVIGLTATPERADGKALTQFEHMIVAATYSELIAAGLIVPAKVYYPEARLDGLARDPVDAYQHYAPGTKGFCFLNNVELARDVTKRFNEAGVPAVAIEGRTATRTRDAAIKAFRAGELQMISCYGTMVEGVDVADAQTCILGRSAKHEGTYLQICGRVLRAHRSKRMAIILDLVGAYVSHGLPHADRTYSLNGKAISLATLAPLKVCPACGLTQISGRTTCEGCAYTFPVVERKRPTIYTAELRAVFDWEDTPVKAKYSEWQRVIDLSAARGYSIDFSISSYTATFGEKPPQAWLDELTPERKAREFRQWRDYAASRGFKKNYAYARYIGLFGHPPPRA